MRQLVYAVIDIRDLMDGKEFDKCIDYFTSKEEGDMAFGLMCECNNSYAEGNVGVCHKTFETVVLYTTLAPLSFSNSEDNHKEYVG